MLPLLFIGLGSYLIGSAKEEKVFAEGGKLYEEVKPLSYCN